LFGAFFISALCASLIAEDEMEKYASKNPHFPKNMLLMSGPAVLAAFTADPDMRRYLKELWEELDKHHDSVAKPNNLTSKLAEALTSLFG
jgi:hypothetical protein